MSEIANFLSEYSVLDNLIVERGIKSLPKGCSPEGMIVRSQKDYDPSYILSNGDDGMWGLGGESDGTISFRCLGRFFNDGKEADQDLLNKIASNIEVVYITKDDWKSGAKNNKPGPGYVWLPTHKQWHRSASVLFYVTPYLRMLLPDHISELDDLLYILMGVDDDQYFGTLFPSKTTVNDQDEAYSALKPEHIRKVDPENICRQGEWFFIRIEDDPMTLEGGELIPPIKNDHHADCHSFPLRSRNDSPESNTHVVTCENIYFVDDTFNINGGKKIPIFGDHNDIQITHNQHEALYIVSKNKYYWWAVENTALLSYSEMGVD